MFFVSNEEIGNEFVSKRIAPDSIIVSGAEKKYSCVILDVETEGLDNKGDKVIELAFIPFSLDAEYKITKIYEKHNYCQFNDPGRPIKQKIIDITGITDEMVSGQSLNIELIRKTLKACDFIFAHNAKFDAGFIYRLLGVEDKFNFVCTQSDINWDHCTAKRLEILCASHGGFYNSHRALDDCYATLWLLSQREYMREAVENSGKPKIMFEARNSHISTKDVLKENGYYWNPDEKVWYKIVEMEKSQEEESWLTDNIYHGNRNMVYKAIIDRPTFYIPKDLLTGK